MIKSITSKKVGWRPRTVRYPATLREIDEADEEQMLEWYRHLPSPETPEQIAMLCRIMEEM